MLEQQTDPWTLYLYSLKSPVSREKYPQRLAKFFDYLGLPQDIITEEQSKIFFQKASSDPQYAFNSIIKFVMFLLEKVERKEMVAATVRGYVKSIKLYCEMADLPISWKKITRGIPRARRYADDRAPTLEELTRLVEYPDRRIKAIVFSMVSGGFRLGSWDYLRWRDVEPIVRDHRVVAAKVRVYAGEDEEYPTFISAEAYSELAEWIKYREKAGEKISPESWLMRDLWDTRVAKGRGRPITPNKLESVAIKRLLERALWAQGLRTKLEEGKKRHEYQAVHSLRKYFKTKCESAGMKPINVETLMGHTTGISDSYYRPTENDLLEDYLKVADALTLSPEKKLESEIEHLKIQTEELDLIKSRYHDLKETIGKRDDQIDILSKDLESLKEMVRLMMEERKKQIRSRS